jgi:hypothetical protein
MRLTQKKRKGYKEGEPLSLRTEGRARPAPTPRFIRGLRIAASLCPQ